MTPAVTATGLELGYGSKVVLEESSFVIPAGGVVAVIGPNGSGKSTLLSAIAGLIEPFAGSLDVAVDARRLALVLQATKVSESLPVTVQEVVTMGRYAALGAFRRLRPPDYDAVESAMERMGILDLATSHVNELSGGQRQRVFVAQGLAQDHDMILLDEPLTGIDIVTAQSIDDVIHEETQEGCTVIMTTHDLSEARIADYVLLLAGRVIASGPPEVVLSDTNLINAYGTSLLHVENGQVFLDDPAHSPVGGVHAHVDKSIHTETDRGDLHG